MQERYRRVQEGYNRGTGGVQEGYRGGAGRVQEGRINRRNK